MLKVLGIMAVVLLVAVGVLVTAAAMQPDTFRVQRSIRIAAPPEKIFPLINDFAQWSGWSPYENKDPAMKRTLSAPASGQGAVYAWEGDHNVGKGRMAIAEAEAPSRITLTLDFEKPMVARNIVDFTLEPKGAATDVTWAMRGKVPFKAKIVHTLMNMDRMVGDDFEAGLANLKKLAERQ